MGGTLVGDEMAYTTIVFREGSASDFPLRGFEICDRQPHKGFSSKKIPTPGREA
jgi:hypothetical protein